MSEAKPVNYHLLQLPVRSVTAEAALARRTKRALKLMARPGGVQEVLAAPARREQMLAGRSVIEPGPSWEDTSRCALQPDKTGVLDLPEGTPTRPSQEQLLALAPQIEEARDFCGGCRETGPCLEDALASLQGERPAAVIRAGTLPGERLQIARRRERAALAARTAKSTI